jgi:hypothetical protein
MEAQRSADGFSWQIKARHRRPYILPNQIEWKGTGGNRSAVLVGDPEKPGLYIVINKWLAGDNFSRRLRSTGNGRNPIFNGRRQPSCGGTSRMTRECQVRICERLGVKFPGPTRPSRRATF